MFTRSKQSVASIVLVSSWVLVLIALLDPGRGLVASEARERDHKAMREFSRTQVEPTTTAATNEDLQEDEAADDDDLDDSSENEENKVTAGASKRTEVTTTSSGNYFATTPKIVKSTKVLSRYEQGLEDYEEAADRVEQETKHQSVQQYSNMVNPILTLFNVISSALSSGRSMRVVGPDPALILGLSRKGDDGSSGYEDKNINSEKSTSDDDDDDDDADDDADNQNGNSTAVAAVEGRYIKGDPLNGYYDFVISEGSYKFWAAFQVVTALLIIYSTFAAIYYSKVSPLTSDYDYIDYLNGGRSFAGGRSIDGVNGRAAAGGNMWDGLLNKPWFNVATQSFAFVMDAIERVPK